MATIQRAYIDNGAPVVWIEEKTLSDGSKAYDLEFGDDARRVACESLKKAQEAFTFIAAGLKIANGGQILVL